MKLLFDFLDEGSGLIFLSSGSIYLVRAWASFLVLGLNSDVGLNSLASSVIFGFRFYFLSLSNNLKSLIRFYSSSGTALSQYSFFSSPGNPFYHSWSFSQSIISVQTGFQLFELENQPLITSSKC